MGVRKGKANIHCATRGLHASGLPKRPPRWAGSVLCRTLGVESINPGPKGAFVVSALVWWAIPVVITAVAVAVVALRSRLGDPGPDPMTERLRLREAMERPIPRDPRGRSPQ